MKFKLTKGKPITQMIDGKEVQCLFFEEDEESITVLLINNTFSESEKRRILKK